MAYYFSLLVPISWFSKRYSNWFFQTSFWNLTFPFCKRDLMKLRKMMIQVLKNQKYSSSQVLSKLKVLSSKRISVFTSLSKCISPERQPTQNLCVEIGDLIISSYYVQCQVLDIQDPGDEELVWCTNSKDHKLIQLCLWLD